MSSQRRASGKPTGLFIAGLVLTAIVLALRIWLPHGVQRYVNGVLRDIPGYTGSVGDIDIALFRGAYVIEDLSLKKVDAESEIPFLDVQKIDVSIEWKSLLHGEIVSELILTRPQLRYVFEDHRESQSAEPDAGDWTEAVRDLAPVEINHFELIDGQVAFLQISAEPTIDLHLDQLDLVATNLRNVVSRDGKLESTVHASAVSIGGGSVKLDGRMNLLRRIPDLDLSLALESADVRAFNDFSAHYAGLDFEAGSISVYSELAIADGYMVGYVKPLLSDIQLIGGDDDLLDTLWEGLVRFFSFILENHDSDAIATKVPFEGDLNNVETGVFAAIANIFRNAWVEAFERAIDDDVEIGDAQRAAAQE